MARKPIQRPPEQDPWALSEAAGYAFTLLHKHGHAYPAFAQIAQRVQRESLRLEDLESQHRSAAAYGFAMETTLHNMRKAGYKAPK